MTRAFISPTGFSMQAAAAKHYATTALMLVGLATVVITICISLYRLGGTVGW